MAESLTEVMSSEAEGDDLVVHRRVGYVPRLIQDPCLNGAMCTAGFRCVHYHIEKGRR